MSHELPFWLVLWRLPTVGPKCFQKLCAINRTLSTYFIDQQPSKELLNLLNLPIDHIFDWEGVERDLAWAQHPSHTIITWADAFYPELLKQISCPPPVLFVKGNCSVLRSTQVAMVGSRQPTPVGINVAGTFAKALVEQGITVTSGLALGIDTAAHQGALLGQGCTIGILGHGIDILYPARNRQLAEKILAQGAVISEFPIGIPPQPKNFPRRNRLISGLSRGVLVVEATVKSGSLITAKYALEQNREIFAVPGSVHNPMAKGCHVLIRDGAKLVEEVQDILEELSLTSSNLVV